MLLVNLEEAAEKAERLEEVRNLIEAISSSSSSNREFSLELIFGKKKLEIEGLDSELAAYLTAMLEEEIKTLNASLRNLGVEIPN
jgi:hypothetical protein